MVEEQAGEVSRALLAGVVNMISGALPGSIAAAIARSQNDGSGCTLGFEVSVGLASSVEMCSRSQAYLYSLLQHFPDPELSCSLGMVFSS